MCVRLVVKKKKKKKEAYRRVLRPRPDLRREAMRGTEESPSGLRERSSSVRLVSEATPGERTTRLERRVKQDVKSHPYPEPAEEWSIWNLPVRAR